jgi:hypothetical protein
MGTLPAFTFCFALRNGSQSPIMPSLTWMLTHIPVILLQQIQSGAKRRKCAEGRKRNLAVTTVIWLANYRHPKFLDCHSPTCVCLPRVSVQILHGHHSYDVITWGYWTGQSHWVTGSITFFQIIAIWILKCVFIVTPPWSSTVANAAHPVFVGYISVTGRLRLLCLPPGMGGFGWELDLHSHVWVYVASANQNQPSFFSQSEYVNRISIIKEHWLSNRWTCVCVCVCVW